MPEHGAMQAEIPQAFIEVIGHTRLLRVKLHNEEFDLLVGEQILDLHIFDAHMVAVMFSGEYHRPFADQRR